MLVKLFRYIQGYLIILVIGFSPERFLNLCKNKNIEIWGLNPQKDTYQMYIKARDFKKIKPLLRKTVSKVKVEKKVGLPFFFFRFRRRKIFFVSILCSIIFVSVMSTRLWTIELSGNQIITEDIMIDFLKRKEISLGIKCKDISCEKLGKEIREHFQEIKWVSVSLDGTELDIIIKENHDRKTIENSNMEPSDIIADKNGTITKLVTRSGVPLCSVGLPVKKGDVLVSGKIDVLNDAKEVIGNRYVISEAEIWANTYYVYRDSLSKTYMKKEYKDKSTYKIKGFIDNYQLTIDFDTDSEYLKEEHTLSDTLNCPFFVQFTEVKEYKFVSADYTEREREQILKDRFERYCEDLELSGCIILENKLQIIHMDNRSYVSSIIKTEEKIGENRKIIDLSSENMVQ